MYIGLICQGDCNKVSQTGWLKQQTFIISVQGVESQIKCWRSRFLLRAVQALLASLRASGILRDLSGY